MSSTTSFPICRASTTSILNLKRKVSSQFGAKTWNGLIFPSNQVSETEVLENNGYWYLYGMVKRNLIMKNYNEQVSVWRKRRLNLLICAIPYETFYGLGEPIVSLQHWRANIYRKSLDLLSNIRLLGWEEMVQNYLRLKGGKVKIFWSKELLFCWIYNRIAWLAYAAIFYD